MNTQNHWVPMDSISYRNKGSQHGRPRCWPSKQTISKCIIKNIPYNVIFLSFWKTILSSRHVTDYKWSNVKQCHTPQEFNRRQNNAIARTRVGHTFFTHYFHICHLPPPPNSCAKLVELITLLNVFLKLAHDTIRPLKIPVNIKKIHEDQTKKKNNRYHFWVKFIW